MVLETLKHYSSWTGTAAFALPIWIGTSVMLTARFLRNPARFCRRVKRDVSSFPDPVENINHCHLDVEGVRLHAVTSGLGSGKPLLVLLHGFPETWHSWRHQVAAFAGEYEIIALDMRGFGLSDAPKGVAHYSMGRLCKDIVATVKGAGHKRCLLAGHDWGGAVAWCFAANYPEMVERLVVLCSPHPAAFKDPQRFNSEQAMRSWYFLLFMGRFLPELWVGCRDFEQVEKMMTLPPMGTVVNGAISKDDVDRYKACLSRPGALTAAINYYRCSIRDQTLKPSPELQRGVEAVLQMPVLLMYADRDAAFCHGMFEGTEHNVPNLELVKLPNCSHWAQQDRHELVTAQMRQFFSCNKKTPTGNEVELVAQAQA